MVYSFFQDARSLVLFSALAAVGAKRININSEFSRFVENLNTRQRNVGITKRPLPEIPLGERVKYYDAAFLGVDSLKRTGECWQEVRKNDAYIDIQYGFHLMTIVLSHLEIDGKNMSGFVRIRDNSIHLAYTVRNTSHKCLTLNALKVEKLGNVQFGASRTDYDGISVDGLFKLVVIPTLNQIVSSNIRLIEAALQTFCQMLDFQKDGGYVEQLLMSFFSNMLVIP